MRRLAFRLGMLLPWLASAALAAPPTFEPQTDLPGFDYRNFDLPRPRPRLCQDACAGDAQCHAWTFVQTGILGPLASCWLKTGTAEKRTNACCISGEK